MNKSEAIQIANESLRANLLNEGNTQFSQVVRYVADDGWWLNIPLANFRKENHFLISELNPFPEIREPLIKDNAWQNTYTTTSDGGGSEKWKTWQGTTFVNSTYRIRDIQTIKTNIGFFNFVQKFISRYYHN